MEPERSGYHIPDVVNSVQKRDQRKQFRPVREALPLAGGREALDMPKRKEKNLERVLRSETRVANPGNKVLNGELRTARI